MPGRHHTRTAMTPHEHIVAINLRTTHCRSNRELCQDMEPILEPPTIIRIEYSSPIMEEVEVPPIPIQNGAAPPKKISLKSASLGVAPACEFDRQPESLPVFVGEMVQRKR